MRGKRSKNEIFKDISEGVNKTNIGHCRSQSEWRDYLVCGYMLLEREVLAQLGKRLSH